MNTFFKLFLVALISVASCSQPQKEQDDSQAQVEKINTAAASGNGMQAAQDAFSSQYPNARDVEWGTDENGYYEATFEQDGEKYRADYSKEGEWIETENSLKWDKLPKAVQEVVKKQFNKDEITEIERVEHSSRGVFYDVEFKKKGKNMDIEIREDGEIIKQ